MLRSAALTAAALALVTGCASRSSLFLSPDEVGVKSAPAQATRVAASVKRAAPLRAGPDRGSPVVANLAEGAQVTAADQAARGFRRVRTADGKSGYVEDGALSLSSAASAPSTSGTGSAGR